MKLFVDLDDRTYKKLKSGEWCGHTTLQAICTAIIDGVPIPDSVTNGDMIKVLFSRQEILEKKSGIYLMNGEMYQGSFGVEWWNAPYGTGLKEDTDESNN